MKLAKDGGEWRRARHRRGNQPVERKIEKDPANPVYLQTCAQRLHSLSRMRVAIPNLSPSSE